jgi:hypothetical protein
VLAAAGVGLGALGEVGTGGSVTIPDADVKKRRNRPVGAVWGRVILTEVAAGAADVSAGTSDRASVLVDAEREAGEATVALVEHLDDDAADGNDT